jgi:hypothetical protein
VVLGGQELLLVCEIDGVLSHAIVFRLWQANERILV